MSRTPSKAVSVDSAESYVQGFQTLNRLEAEGRSFSGFERHCVFLNMAGSRFANVSATSGLDFLDDGRGLAFVDWDFDGDLDLWSSNRTAPQARFLRNDTQSESHFLAVRLEGQTCNRDAIGARVEVVLEGQQSSQASNQESPNQESANQKSKIKNHKYIKTLYAGHGFLAQSSKWLHFGLGPHTEIDRLIVRWPGGASETFKDIRVDHRYRLAQSSGKAELWTAPERQLTLTPSDLEGTPATTAGRVFLAARAPIPSLTYQRFNDESVELTSNINGPTLLNLWASWCIPCLAELKEWSKREEQLSKAGLRVIALSVDGLDESKLTTPADARNKFREMNLPFEGGFANPELLSKLQLLHNLLIYRRIPLEVPTSFLIHSDGQLSAIYRGRVEVDQLLRDVDNLGVTEDQRRALAAPVSGRWATPRNLLRLDVVARGFDDNGYLDDAVTYLREAARIVPDISWIHSNLGMGLTRIGNTKEAVESYRHALQLDATNVDAHYNLAVTLQLQNKLDESIVHYRIAVRFKPDFVRAYNNLGHALSSQGHFDEAIKTFRDALAIDVEFGKAHYNLANVLQAIGEYDDAIVHYREALLREPSSAPTHYNMGNALISQGRVDIAIEHYRKAVEFQNDHADACFRLAVALTMVGRLGDARQQFQEAIQLEPNWPAAMNGLAWILATHPEVGQREPHRATRLAQRAADLTSYQDPAILDTLAASHAAEGDFDRAITTARQALALASEQDETLAKEIRERVNLYLKETPYRDSVAPRD